MTSYTWTERKNKKGSRRLTLQEKFTSNELILMKIIFQNKMRDTDKYYDNPTFDCCPLDHAIKSWSGTPEKITKEALTYLGYLDENGKISDEILYKRYFNVGPIEGSSKKNSWTNDLDIYVTPAGENLVQQVVGVFYIGAHLSLTNIKTVTV